MRDARVREGLRDAYVLGRGGITVQAQMHLEGATAATKRRKATGGYVVITELPYQKHKVYLRAADETAVSAPAVCG